MDSAQNHPQDVVVFILNTATESRSLSPVRPTTSVRKSPRKNLPPRNTPDSFCRRFTRQNPSLCCVGAVFFFRELHLENFIGRPNVIPTFRQRRCANRARNFVRSKRRSTYTSSTTSLIFCALTIRKQLPRNGFERSGSGQESSRGHKFSILENFLSPLGQLLVGACLPQTLPDKSKGALSAPMLFLSLLLFQFKLTLLFCFALFTAKCFSHQIVFFSLHLQRPAVTLYRFLWQLFPFGFAVVIALGSQTLSLQLSQQMN